MTEPTALARPAQRILAVWTRALDGVESVGRVNVARAVRDALAPLGQLSHARLRSVFETRHPLQLARAIVHLLHGALRLRPLPLQCAIFPGCEGGRDALRVAGRSDVVYADGIRTLTWLRQVRRRQPQLRIVLDLDDLMSRRYAEVLARQLPLSLGYLERLVPRPLARLATSAALSRLVMGYERLALRHAEIEALQLADQVVLLSAHEAALLRRTAAELPGASRAGVLAIPPPAPAVLAPRPALRAPWRAVFIGTDGLVQNRLTIDYLLDLWERERVTLPLVFYGRWKRARRAVPGTVCAGYAPDLGTIYAPGSLLLCPAFLPGGIKTKVLEGFAHQVPVIGNATSFEGLALGDYPLQFGEEAALLDFLADPSAQHGRMAAAVARGAAMVAAEHDTAQFRQRWAVAMGAAPAVIDLPRLPVPGPVPAPIPSGAEAPVSLVARTAPGWDR
jgi:hypothetical protein